MERIDIRRERIPGPGLRPSACIGLPRSYPLRGEDMSRRSSLGREKKGTSLCAARRGPHLRAHYMRQYAA